jgi:hypothetical protein
MQVRKKLKPGQDGTRSLLDKYGDQMVCVRYRYDEERRLRYKTVELIVETVPWEPLTEIPADTVVGLKVGLQEIELQSKIRQVGGKWNRGRQVLELSYDKVLALGLASRIDLSTLPNNGKVKLPSA